MAAKSENHELFFVLRHSQIIPSVVIDLVERNGECTVMGNLEIAQLIQYVITLTYGTVDQIHKKAFLEHGDILIVTIPKIHTPGGFCLGTVYQVTHPSQTGEDIGFTDRFS